jgi:hypothetical protein
MADPALWYYCIGSQRIGPIPEPIVIQMLQAGQLGRHSLVWTEGMEAWLSPAAVPALAPFVIGSHDIGDDAGMRLLLPVGRSPWAIAAGYLGLVALVPVIGLVAGPAAIICAILAFRDMKRDPRLHGMGRAVTGIVLGGIGFIFSLVVLAGLVWGR